MAILAAKNKAKKATESHLKPNLNPLFAAWEGDKAKRTHDGWGWLEACRVGDRRSIEGLLGRFLRLLWGGESVF
jgi:hypothetical protein